MPGWVGRLGVNRVQQLLNDIARIDVRHQARTESLRQIDEAGNVEIEVVEDVPLQLDARGVLGGARQRTRRRGIPGTGQAEQRHRRIVYRALVIASIGRASCRERVCKYV